MNFLAGATLILALAAPERTAAEDQGHYPLDQGGGVAVSSADLEQYLVALQERATARQFLLTFGDLLFATNSAQISEDGKSELLRMADFLRQHPETVAQIVGYTDDRGDAMSNLNLAEERASVVRHYLIAQGIDVSRLMATTGEQANPAGDNRIPAGRDSNRRVQIFVQKQPVPAD